jgi:hypothetical protein
MHHLANHPVNTAPHRFAISPPKLPRKKQHPLFILALGFIMALMAWFSWSTSTTQIATLAQHTDLVNKQNRINAKFAATTRTLPVFPDSALNDRLKSSSQTLDAYYKACLKAIEETNVSSLDSLLHYEANKAIDATRWIGSQTNYPTGQYYKSLNSAQRQTAFNLYNNLNSYLSDTTTVLETSKATAPPNQWDPNNFSFTSYYQLALIALLIVVTLVCSHFNRRTLSRRAKAVYSILTLGAFLIVTTVTCAIFDPQGNFLPTALLFKLASSLYFVAFGVGILFLVIIAIAFYFLPTIIAAVRKHPQTGGILLVNALGGWLVIGWIAALIWSFITPQPTPVLVVPPPLPSHPAPRPIDDLQRLAELLERGILTQEEFESQKQKVLAT